MSHALVNYLVPVPPAHQGAVERALDGLGWHPRPNSPCMPGAEQLEHFVHFMSMVVLPRDDERDDLRALLLIEVCADVGGEELASRLARVLEQELGLVFEALGEGRLGADALADRLRRHVMGMGTSLLTQPGLGFVGSPGMSVYRIQQEARLASRVREILLGDAPLPRTALGKLASVRAEIFRDADLKWALFSEPVPVEAKHSGLSRGFRLAQAALRDYLWALLPLPLLLGLVSYFHEPSLWPPALLYASGVLAVEGLLVLLLLAFGNQLRRVWALLPLPLLAALIEAFPGWSAAVHAMARAWQLLALEALVLALVVAYGYRCLRSQEDADDPLDREPDAKLMGKLMSQENYRGVAQNHLAAQSRVKPGWVRRWTLRLALWTVAEVTQVRSTPGFLGKIGTIHFARWVLVPGTDRLVFLSNYDGSWQSYLEDFVARLRQGLSSVWSNTRDFPKTSRLVSGGAADGTRFKRWARRQQLSSPAWFTAYRQLTAATIRTNAALRHSLASATTEAQAAAWLSRLGYAATDALDADQVSTLVFGRLSRLRHSRVLVLKLDPLGGVREWLAQCLPDLSYGPHEGQKPAWVIGFTATGLGKLGLPDAALHSFPTAFQQGMGHPDRARLLGDPVPGGLTPLWGMNGDEVDAICLVYADTETDLQAAVATMQARLDRHGHKASYQRGMAVLPAKEGDSGPRVVHEPFGFRDGLSQPIVRGTRGWTEPRNAQHVVNPGEFVLGYQDNLGKRAPTPCAGHTDVGRDGTFLVVRHLQQNVDDFNKCLYAQARRLARDGPLAGMKIDEAREWVAAKMVGRWRSGAPLVRSPESPKAAPDNDFMYGEEDPDGLRCPFGAHIRRANPRDSLDPKSKVQLAISNRHRILRVGRPLDTTEGGEPGLMFMCLNADIERQFEFLQQTWLLGPNFHGLDNETDALLGSGEGHPAMTVPGVGGPVRLESLRRFVTTLGGGYFFVPGKACMERLAGTMREGPEG